MIRVMLIADYPLIANLITTSLHVTSEIEVVGSYTPNDSLLHEISESGIDVLLISGELAAVRTLDLVTQIDSLKLPLSIIVLGLEERQRSILPFLEAGASGYIPKDASVDDLITAIHSAYDGQAQVSPQIARALIERMHKLSSRFDKLDASVFDNVKITWREMQVLELLDQNLTNQEIADQLTVEVGTVKNHVHSILKKLEVDSRQEAAKYLGLLKSKGFN